MTPIQKTKHFLLNNKYKLIAASVAILAILYFLLGGKKEIQTTQVKKGTIEQKVIVTGKTKPVSSVELSFEKSGKVGQTYVDVGSKVYVGQTLVTLNQSQSYSDYLRAQANLDAEKARLSELQAGTRPEELEVSAVGITNAKQALLDSEDNLRAKLVESYTKADDAIHNSIDQFFSNARTTNPQITITVNDSQLKNDLNLDRYKIENLLSNWPLTTDTAPSNIATINNDLNIIKAFVDKTSTAVNELSSSGNISQSTVDSYRASVSSARTNLATAISNLSSANTTRNSARSAVTLAQSNYDLKKTGNTKEAIDAQRARVSQMEAGLVGAEADLSKYTLHAPINGVVTKQDAKPGQIVTPGQPVVSIISESDLEIESNVSEVSIGKVAVGNEVNITMDAFPGKAFKGRVTYIEPAETVVNGVVNFKVTIVFSEKYPEVKSGLTASLDIKTSSKNNVLLIPQYAVTVGDLASTTASYVTKVINEKQKKKVLVILGVVGYDGSVEVISGLNEGDVIDLSTTITSK